MTFKYKPLAIHTKRSFREGVTVVGGGTCTTADIFLASKYAPRLVGADSGGHSIKKAGLVPECVVGDFDSIPDQILKALPSSNLIRIWDQDRTDFDKCIGVVDAPFYVGVGVLGDRVDHALSALNTLLHFPHKIIILFNESDLCFLTPPSCTLRLSQNERVSLFPFGEMKGKSAGLKWEINTIAFAPDGMTGTSNQTVDGHVELEFDQPRMVCIVARENLGSILESLVGAEHWPAPDYDQ